MRSLLLLLLLPLAATADEQPYLVRDLPGVTVRDSIGFGPPPVWTTIGNTTWFVARTTAGITEIFKTDGTYEGTLQVTHGTGTADEEGQTFLGVVDGKLIYGIFDRIYALDTAGGQPELLARVGFRSYERGTTLGGLVYFTASTAAEGRELWRTDGTPAGTSPIDLLPGEDGVMDFTRNLPFFTAGGSIVFFGKTPQGSGLHRTDGTPAGTALLLPLDDLTLYNDISSVTTVGGRVLFLYGNSGESPAALWATDGTAAGTAPIAQVSDFDPLGTLGGQILFTDRSGVIWTTDGTAAGTRPTDIFRIDSSLIHAGGVVGDSFYFFAGLPTETLYVTKGTLATTRAIMEVEHGGFHVIGEGFAAGGRFVFRHNDGIHGMELWSTDGTTAELLADINPGYRRGIDSGATAEDRPDGTAIFTAVGPGTGREPWITDGTPAGTRLLANIAAEDPVHGSSPHSLRASGERLFFMATLPEGQAIGVSDGTRAGTSATAVDFDWTINATAAATGRYFYSVSEANPFGVYATDGTVAGRVGIFPEPTTAHPLPSGVLLLRREDHTVWFSDGTVAGTRMLPGITSFQFPRILPAGSLAWITAPGRLWRTDGTDAGTIEILPAEPRNGEIYGAIDAGTSWFLLESGNGSAPGPRLWRSDGTPSGTTVVKAFGANANTPSFVGAAGGLVYVALQTLVRSDGTEAGTFALPGPTPCPGVALGDILLFTTPTPSNTINLWRTDGTVEGTVQVAALPATRQFAGCRTLVVRGDRAYFSGWSAAHGSEPWVTDGTAAGTKMVADIFPGPTSSAPQEFTVAGERLFFSANSPGNGRELWAIGRNPGPVRRRSVGAR